MAEFFHMGGYAFFVWTSYLVVAVVFGYLYFAPVFRHRSVKLSLAADIQELERRGAGAGPRPDNDDADQPR